MNTNGIAVEPAKRSSGATDEAVAVRAAGNTAAVWKALEHASFAVECHVNSAGEPRSSGVVYGIVDRRLYIAVATDGWKARQIVTGQEISLTVPVRRGGILSLLMPIPPATITFRATATVHPAGSLDVRSVSTELAKLVPDDRKESSCIIELVPEGWFVTYGIGVSLMAMREPMLARARVPVS
jgi:hypothetical protein